MALLCRVDKHGPAAEQRDRIQYPAVQILNGAVILALGGFMHSVQNLSHASNYFFFSVVYTGYSTWGAMFFIVSGILSVLAGKNPTKTLLESSLGMHTASATVAVTGIVFLSMNLFANHPLLKGCQSSQPPDLCIYMEASSNGLISLMLVLTLLELCIACSVAALWLKANCCHLRKKVAAPPPGIFPTQGLKALHCRWIPYCPGPSSTLQP
ncbi:membrane-spanning 4-domains subfamily A member 3 [Oryx dammah]|uniref:membrane-spanning 4-domains subfamily A member 3 n=1 Tax=Oryx dammah TaxID=59534 RepID=UPI001A9C0592|nr:membrane-spanning 4-domains subfamily A member 3 [Oryx dammah]